MLKRVLTVLGMISVMAAGAQADAPRPDPRVVACEWTTQELEAINGRAGANYRNLLLYQARLNRGELTDVRERLTAAKAATDYLADLVRWEPRVQDVISSLHWECSDYPRRGEASELALRLTAGMRLLKEEALLVLARLGG